MQQGLDLSRFKKVSSDKKTTTLRHAKGHEIKIAHSGLTPKMREMVDALEKHEDPKMMAEGGDPVEPELDVDPVSPEPVPEDAPQQALSAVVAPAAPAAPVETAPQAPEAVAPQAPAAPQAPQGLNPAELKQEDAAWAQDLANGHVTPKTYGDLFAKKDTLGKIGTIFGLMVSGAGSGLSHQPNALIEMMNKQISNDLEAQKASKTNATTYRDLNLKQHMNSAQISKMQKEGLLTDAQAKSMLADARTKSYTLARMQMNRSALHSLVLQVNKMPVGSPQRQAAEQSLALLTQGVQSENYDLADRAAAASALGNLAFGNGTPGSKNPEGDFNKKTTALRLSGNAPLADDATSKHIPGVEGSSSIPVSGADREKVNSGITFQRQLDDFISWTKNHSGDLNPAERKEGIAKAAAIQAAYRQASNGGVYKEGEQNFIGKIINDVPTVFLNKIRVLPSLNAVKQESAMQLDQHLKSLGFKGYKGGSETKTAGAKTPKEGDTGTYKDSSGATKAVVFNNGKWKRK